jgi:S1-C subfamily serine protease
MMRVVARSRRIACWAASAAALLVSAPVPAAASTRPVVALPPDRLVQLARPATVLVRTKLKGKVTTPGGPSDEAIAAFFRTDPAAQAAARARDTKGLIDAFLGAMATDPARFTAGTDSEDVDIEATGSGFVIADGTVMTNSHVVFGDEAGTAKAAVEEIVGGVPGVRDALAAGLGKVPYTPELLDRASVAMHDHLLAVSKADGVTKVVTIDRAARSGPTTFTASTTKAGARYPGDDLALLSVTELRHVPTLRFAATEPRAGEDVYVLGFPGAATFASGTDKASALIPSFTKGIVSAAKTTESGVPVLQFDASLAPGNSGGPVFSKTGEVVGVSVAGIESAGNFNFAIAGTTAASFAATKPTTATSTKEGMLLEHSLRSLEAGWLRVADTDLKDLEKAFPDETVVTDLRAELTRRRAAKEVDLSPDPPRSSLLLGLSAASAVLLLVAASTTGVSWRSHRRRRSRASAGDGGA